jgi:hypothetical protein
MQSLNYVEKIYYFQIQDRLRRETKIRAKILGLCPSVSLKVLSSKMDLAKSGLIPKALLKGEARRFSVNCACPLSPESPSKF